nr:NADH dehydrogenase subunit 2 [Onuxodon fowleri]
MNPFILASLLLSLGLGTTITFASSHWFLAWMGLEINTLAIIPLMARKHHPRAVEATTKYFLVQATAASMILFASTVNAWETGQWQLTEQMAPVPATITMLALSLKLGMAPLHTWLPEVLQGLDLTTGLIMSTWQKMAPFSILVQLQGPTASLLIIIGLMSTMIGGWGGLNQTQLRKILAYSSIAHMGWMVMVVKFAPHLTLFALIMYIVTTAAMFLTFKYNKAFSINALSSSSTTNPALTALTPLLLFSLGGLPPLAGFAPKWMILQELTKQDLPVTATLAALTALLSLYFYLRVAYALTLTSSPNTSPGLMIWRLQTSQGQAALAASMSLSLLILPLMPSIVAMFTP